MLNPGIKNLASVALAALNAATTQTVVTSVADQQGVTQAYVDGLEGMLSASIEANFTAGSGGTSVKAIVETTFDQGVTWIEVARFAFTTSNATKVVNLSGLTPVTTVYAPVALSDDAVKDGLLGPRFRASILTTGTYAGNAALALRLVAR